MANTLYEYYQSIGQSLPSVQQRSGLASQAGITGPYTGTASQNNQLLSYLQTQKSSTPTPGATQTNTNANVGAAPTMGNLFGTNQPQAQAQAQAQTPTASPAPSYANFSYNQTPQMTAENDMYSSLLAQAKTDSSLKTDPTQIRNDVLQRYQREIDATRQIYANKLAEARKAGQGRIGQTTAINARAGLLGSDFGAANADQTVMNNQQIEQGIQSEEALMLAQIGSKIDNVAAQELKDRNEAKRLGAEKYIEYLSKQTETRKNNVNGLATQLLAAGVDIANLNPTDLDKWATQLGVSANDIKSSYKKAKQEAEAAQAKLDKDSQTLLGEGQMLYDRNGKLIAENKKEQGPVSVADGGVLVDPVTGKVIYSNPKNFAGNSNGSNNIVNPGGIVDPQVQAYVDAVNNGANLDEILKGTSIQTQNLRGRVIAELNKQAGIPDKTADMLQEGKDIVDDLIKSGADKALGGWSTRLGGQFGTSYGDAKAKVNQLSAILARDNLGLLKGAMSDKDLAFIQAMSSGFEGEGIQSEKYISERLATIQKKLAEKLAAAGTSNQNSTTVVAPDGKTYTFPTVEAANAFKRQIGQ